MNRSIITTYFILVFLIAFSKIFGQNLVPNYSFEDYSECPNTSDMDNFVSNWYSCFGTCDYYNGCNVNDFSVPQNIAGYQMAFDGKAYIGAFLYFGMGNTYSEYSQVELITKLEKNKEYCVSFYVSIADSAQYAIDCIGLLFSDTPILGVHFSDVGITPHIYNQSGNVIKNTEDWIEIKGVYTASGNENYITVGCFANYPDVDTFEFNSNPFSSLSYSSYYYFDNVYVGLCETEEFIPNIITPNDDGINDVFELKLSSCENCELIIYNRWGSMLFYTDSPQNLFWDGKFNGQFVNDGIYFYILRNKNAYKKGTIHLIK